MAHRMVGIHESSRRNGLLSVSNRRAFLPQFGSHLARIWLVFGSYLARIWLVFFAIRDG